MFELQSIHIKEYQISATCHATTAPLLLLVVPPLYYHPSCIHCATAHRATGFWPQAGPCTPLALPSCVLRYFSFASDSSVKPFEPRRDTYKYSSVVTVVVLPLRPKASHLMYTHILSCLSPRSRKRRSRGRCARWLSLQCPWHTSTLIHTLQRMRKRL